MAQYISHREYTAKTPYWTKQLTLVEVLIQRILKDMLATLSLLNLLCMFLFKVSKLSVALYFLFASVAF